MLNNQKHEITLSVSPAVVQTKADGKKIACGFEQQVFNLKNPAKLKKTLTQHVHSLNVWDGGQIKDKDINQIIGVNGLMLDFDGNATFKKLKERFNDYIYVIYSSTGNGDKLPNGDKIPKFHVLLPFDPTHLPAYPNDTDALYAWCKDQQKEGEFHGADKCLDIGRKFYPYCEAEAKAKLVFHVNIDGTYFPFPDVTKFKEKAEPGNVEIAPEEYIKQRTRYIKDLWELPADHPERGDKQTFELALDCQRSGNSIDEATDKVIEWNSQSDQPMPIERVKGRVESAYRGNYPYTPPPNKGDETPADWPPSPEDNETNERYPRGSEPPDIDNVWLLTALKSGKLDDGSLPAYMRARINQLNHAMACASDDVDLRKRLAKSLDQHYTAVRQPKPKPGFFPRLGMWLFRLGSKLWVHNFVRPQKWKGDKELIAKILKEIQQGQVDTEIDTDDNFLLTGSQMLAYYKNQKMKRKVDKRTDHRYYPLLLSGLSSICGLSGTGKTEALYSACLNWLDNVDVGSILWSDIDDPLGNEKRVEVLLANNPHPDRFITSQKIKSWGALIAACVLARPNIVVIDALNDFVGHTMGKNAPILSDSIGWKSFMNKFRTIMEYCGITRVVIIDHKRWDTADEKSGKATRTARASGSHGKLDGVDGAIELRSKYTNKDKKPQTDDDYGYVACYFIKTRAPHEELNRETICYPHRGFNVYSRCPEQIALGYSFDYEVAKTAEQIKSETAVKVDTNARNSQQDKSMQAVKMALQGGETVTREELLKMMQAGSLPSATQSKRISRMKIALASEGWKLYSNDKKEYGIKPPTKATKLTNEDAEKGEDNG